MWEKIKIFFENIIISGQDFLSQFYLFQLIVNSKIFLYIKLHRCLALGISGGIIENSLLSISAGAFAQNFSELILCIFVASFASFITDISLFFFLSFFVSKSRKSLKKYSEKYPRTVGACKKFGIYSMLFYRFVFLARFPALFISSFGDRKKAILLNLLGAFLAQSVFLSFGFFLKEF